MKDILFGAAYYPEYLPGDRLETDMTMMKSMGVNTIRVAESTWSSLEPRDGTFDFSWIDRILEAAGRYEIRVIIGTPTYAIPAWLAAKDPEILLTTREGQASYGHRQIFDITNPTYLACSERVIRLLAEHTVRHPSVIGYQVDNETKHFHVTSRRAQKMFVDYLRKQFPDPEDLNRAFCLRYWSNSIDDWDDFPDITGCINAGLACEYERFLRKLAADFLGWQAAILREYIREDQFITHNLDFEWKKFGANIAQDGYSYGVQPGICHSEAAEHLTLSGTDVYHPTQDAATGAEVAFCGDLTRSLKHEPYLVLETQAQAFKYWTPYPGQLRLDLFSHLASGAMGVLYWNWHSIHNSFETYWKGILSHDLLPNPAYHELAETGKTLRRLGADRLCIRKHSRAALVTDNHSLSALNWHPTDKDLSYNDVVRWMYDSLYELNIECDVVDVRDLNPDQYSWILLPELYSVTDELVQRLNAFVSSGGVLLATFRSFFADEHLNVWADLQPHGMTDCFGISYQQFSDPGTTTLAGHPLSYFMELLKPYTAEVLYSYEHRYWSEYAAVTRNCYGQGKAYYVGCYMDKDLLKCILRQAAADAGIGENIFGEVWPLVIRSGINRRNRKVHYVMNYSDRDREIPCPLSVCTDLLSGVTYRKEEMLRLKDWGVMVLEEDR